MKKYYVVALLILIAGTVFSIRANAAPHAGGKAEPAAATATTAQLDYVGYSSFSADAKYVRARAANAMLFGWQYNHFETRDFSIGGVAYVGELTGANGGSMALGGLSFNYHSAFSPFWAWNVGGLIGASGATFREKATGTKLSSGGVAFEPEAGVRLNLGKRARVEFDVGYLWQPTNNSISGFSSTVKFEFINPLD